MRALGLLVLLGAGSAHAQGGELELGKRLPDFTLMTMNPAQSGVKLVNTKALLSGKTGGKRALVISFGASYCEPCKRELADIEKHRGAIEASGAAFVAVLIDREPEGIEAMRKLLVDELGVKYPVLVDKWGVVARRYKVETLPMLVIAGADGSVRWISTGFKDDAIAKLLAELGIG